MKHLLLSLAFLLTLGLGAQAQESAAYNSSDLAKASQNPVSDLISLPLQNNFFFSEDGGDVTWNLNVQPVIPFSLNEDFNVITRTIAPLFAAEAVPPGFDDYGLGDINTTWFLSPKESGITWGVGPILSFPSATSDSYGTGKWSAGPSLVVLKIAGPWVVGGLASNLWDYAGDDDRGGVNSLLVQPFINYNFDGGWYATSSPILTANWYAPSSERWTIPLGGGFGRVFNIGGQPVNTSLSGFYNVERPDGGAEWSLRFQVQLLFPK